MRGRGKSADKGKKSSQRTTTGIHQGTRFQLNSEQATRILQRVMQGGVLPMPQQVAIENAPRAAEAMLAQQMQAMTDVIYGGQQNLAVDSPDLITSTNALREMTGELMAAYQAELPEVFGHEYIPSQKAEEAITYLKRVLQLGQEVKIKVNPGTAACEELLRVPVNYTFTEILREFLHLHDFNIVMFQHSSIKDDDGFVPDYYCLSLTQVERFKNLFSEWIKFIAPYWKLNKLVPGHMSLIYQNGYLIVANKNKAEQMANGKEHLMIQMKINEVPDALPQFQALVKLDAMIKRNHNVLSLTVLYNQLFLSSTTGELNLSAFPFEETIANNGVKFYTQAFAKLHLLDDETLAKFDEFLSTTNRHVDLIMKFSDKFFGAAKLSYPVKFILCGDEVHYNGDERTDYLLTPLGVLLDAGLDEATYSIKFKIESLKKCFDMDLAPVAAEVAANEALFRCYESLRSRYGDRFMPKIGYAELLKVQIEDLHAREQALLLEDQAEANRKARLESNIKILKTILIDEFARGKQWQLIEDDLCIQPLSIPGQGILRLLNINGLVVDKANKGSARISLIDLQEVDTALLANQAKVAELIGRNLSVIDAMICRVCKNTTDRFTETGIQFELNDECRDIFPKVCEQLYPILKNGNGFYEISYAASAREEWAAVLPKMRKELDAHFKPKEKVEVAKVAPAVKKVVDGHKDKDKGKQEVKHKKKVRQVKAVPAAVPATPKKKVERSGPDVGQQPVQRALPLPPARLDSHTLSVIASAAVAQHEFNVIKDKERKVKIRNAHEGAILQELKALEHCTVWLQSMPVEEVQDVHSVTQLYSMELAMLRLMNAIYERRREFRECQQITVNDFEAAEVRAELIHGLPTLACLLNLSDKIRNDCKLLEVASDIFADKKVSVRKTSLADFMKLFQHAVMAPEDIIKQTFTDLEMLMTFYTRNDGKPETLQNIQRAIKGCIVKLGELSNKAAQLNEAHKISPQLKIFMLECHELRNVAAHNNVSASDFDPLPFEVAHKFAIQGLECWRSMERIESSACVMK